MANVAFIRPEIARLTPMYTLIRDVLSGEPTVKGARTTYLPMPNASDTSPGNMARYKAYIERAVFYAFTERTVSGLLGQVFMRDPVKKIPAALEAVDNDATGGGVSFDQLAKRALSYNVAYSRAGVFVDYPQTDGPITVAEKEKGDIRPTVYVYSPMEIINWRVTERGAREILSLVVLAEPYTFADDGFEMKRACQFRVLKLVDGKYVQEIWRENQPSAWDTSKAPPKRGNFTNQADLTVVPKGPDGQPLDEIPFMFVGAENNDSEPDKPHLYALASLNIAHYRNSADYEEACFIVGQATPVVTGLTQDWYEKVLKKTIAFGSRGGIPLPADADAKLLQAEENGMIKEAMEGKERQAVALGAKLVEQKTVQRTATEAKQDSTSDGSILSSCAKNVSAAMLWALKWCARFEGVAESEIEYALNTDFDLANMTPEEMNSAVKNWQAGALTFKEMRKTLHRAGQATEDDEEAQKTITNETTAALKLETQFNTPTGKPPQGA